MTKFSKIRVSLLLYVLILVAIGSWLTRVQSTSWEEPLWVSIHPYNADGRSNDYISSLELKNFTAIERFIAREAKRYGIKIEEAIHLELDNQISQPPPKPPAARSGLAVIWWSLKMRYYAWQMQRHMEVPSQIQLFVLYYDPNKHKKLAHSLGLQKGMIGVINAFASRSYQASNNVIIAHELLHTLGASDKYDLNTNQPLFPDGYAEPKRKPLLPQRVAEIMAGRIPVSETRAQIPAGLRQVIIGRQTAQEIRWLPSS